jgi:hypothetical protein
MTALTERCGYSSRKSRIKKHHFVLMFLIAAAALQAIAEWDRLHRIAGRAYDLVEAIATKKMIYSEHRVETMLAPLRNEIEALKLRSRANDTCRCSVARPSGASTAPPEARYTLDPPRNR